MLPAHRFSILGSKRLRFPRLLAVMVVGASAALFLGSLGGCAHGGSSGGGPVTVPLSYTPEHARDSIRGYPTAIPQTKIYVGTFQDKRDKPDAIGANTEHDTPVKIVAGSDPARFFQQTLATQLRRAGLTVVDDPSQADRVITGDLLQFWVEESNNYQAEVSALIRVADKSGTVKWQGTETGRGENFGGSLSPENYRQTLSDAMVRLTFDNLLTNAEFQNAIK